MKLFKFFVLLGVMAVAFSSCKKDEFSIEGKWTIDKEIFYSAGIQEEGDIFTGGWFEFKSGGNGVDNDGGTFTWSLKDDKLTMTSGSNSFVWTLTTKEKKKMVMEISGKMSELDALFDDDDDDDDDDEDLGDFDLSGLLDVEVRYVMELSKK